MNEEPDADPGDGRDESMNERLDRNWGEILQELRVTQTGTQIFTGFLLSVAFQQRFGSLSPFQRHTYLVLVLIAVLTTAIGLAPVNLHRSVFRRHAKLMVVTVGHRVLRTMLFGVGLLLVGSVLLIFDVVASRTAAVVAAAAVAVVIGAIAVLPRLLRAQVAVR
ncbi:DUF6328 family protein [uncultured Friedmanniella sp.]|uniref:DUF6328 family protein n=1 Tax=uncultured Friedmanniella sp. TaxID=335381 RepID=UPI0035CA9EF1